jgi:DNA-binding CsgD family transcriptional regulator
MASSRSSAFHGLYWLAASLAEGAPLLVWVDDAHWADGPSAEFLAFMARRVADLEMLLLVAARPAEPGADEALSAIRDQPGAEVISPQPLSDASVARVLRDALAHEPEPAFVSACAQRTGGNPYLLRELALDLRGRGVSPTVRGVAEIDQLGHRKVGRSITARLVRMPAGGRELAEALAILETPSELRLAAAVADVDLEPAAGLADALAAVDILSPGRRLTFRHPLVRAAVYAQIPASRRAVLHGQAADTLGLDAADAQHVAAHLLRSQPRGDPGVVATLRRAAAQAMASAAPITAAAYLARALDEPAASEHRGDLLRALGAAEIAAGRPAGIDHLREAIGRLDDPRDRAGTALELADALAAHMRFDEAGNVLLKGIDAVRDVDRELWLQLEAQLHIVLRADLSTDPQIRSRLDELGSGLRGETPGERSVLAALKGGARVGHASSAAEAAELAESVVAAELGRADGPDPFEDDDVAASATITMATVLELPVLLQTDQLDTTEVYAERILRVARVQGLAFLMMIGLSIRASVAQTRGALPDAEADARLAIAAARDLSRPPPPIIGILLFSLIESGALEEADQHLERFGYAGALPEIMPANQLLFHRARLRMAQDRIHEAIEDLETLGKRYELLGIQRLGTPWRTQLALALHRAERVEDAVVFAREELGMAQDWHDAPRSVAIAQRTLGLVTPDPYEALELLHASVGLLERSPARLDLAYSLVALGAALRRQRHRKDAREILQRGMDTATRCGSSTLAHHARNELLATGARPRRHAITGPDALTPSERRIAQMAARGLTNKQIAQELFLSTRTIETHLRHTCQKLDISSRTQVAAALALTAKRQSPPLAEDPAYDLRRPASA